MKQKERHKLVPQDNELFQRMKGHYVSENERTFFSRLKEKEEYEFTVSNDLLLFEEDNDDHIYIVRCEYEEYVIGHGTEGHYDNEFHSMNLTDALNANLKQLGFVEENLTLLQWLRNRDYAGIQYNHNYDNL